MVVDKNSAIDCISPFSNYLKENEIEEILNHSNIVKYNKREVIFRQNTRTSHIMFVKSGLVKIFKEGRNHKYIILKIAVPFDFLGLMSIYGSDTHQYSASAIHDSEICFVDLDTFNKILQANGEFTLHVINLISNDGLFIFNRLMSQSHKQLPGRIADVILYFSEVLFKSSSDFSIIISNSSNLSSSNNPMNLNISPSTARRFCLINWFSSNIFSPNTRSSLYFP